jgi:hypothetical protein
MAALQANTMAFWGLCLGSQIGASSYFFVLRTRFLCNWLFWTTLSQKAP